MIIFGRLGGIVLFTLCLAGCGYHFAGQNRLELPVAVSAMDLKLTGAGLQDNPMLGQSLRDRMERKLRLGSLPLSKDGPRGEIRVAFERPVRRILVEDRLGRADQVRMEIRGQAVILLDGKPVAPGQITETAFSVYQEERGTSNTKMARQDAEMKAVEKLADALVSRLTSRF